MQWSRPDGSQYLLQYGTPRGQARFFRANNERARIWQMGDPVDGSVVQSRFRPDPKWDIITTMREGNQARIFLYAIDIGDGAMMNVNNDGSGLTELATFDWQAGWR